MRNMEDKIHAKQYMECNHCGELIPENTRRGPHCGKLQVSAGVIALMFLILCMILAVILAIPLFFGHFMDKAEDYANDFGQQGQSHYSSGADSLPE